MNQNDYIRELESHNHRLRRLCGIVCVVIALVIAFILIRDYFIEQDIRLEISIGADNPEQREGSEFMENIWASRDRHIQNSETPNDFWHGVLWMVVAALGLAGIILIFKKGLLRK